MLRCSCACSPRHHGAGCCAGRRHGRRQVRRSRTLLLDSRARCSGLRCCSCRSRRCAVAETLAKGRRAKPPTLACWPRTSIRTTCRSGTRSRSMPRATFRWHLTRIPASQWRCSGCSRSRTPATAPHPSRGGPPASSRRSCGRLGPAERTRGHGRFRARRSAAPRRIGWAQRPGDAAAAAAALARGRETMRLPERAAARTPETPAGTPSTPSISTATGRIHRAAARRGNRRPVPSAERTARRRWDTCSGCGCRSSRWLSPAS